VAHAADVGDVERVGSGLACGRRGVVGRNIFLVGRQLHVGPVELAELVLEHAQLVVERQQ
nr:hypothetical protein [Tanacetum cinerariifolium]